MCINLCVLVCVCVKPTHIYTHLNTWLHYSTYMCTKLLLGQIFSKFEKFGSMHYNWIRNVYLCVLCILVFISVCCTCIYVYMCLCVCLFLCVCLLNKFEETKQKCMKLSCHKKEEFSSLFERPTTRAAQISDLESEFS